MSRTVLSFGRGRIVFGCSRTGVLIAVIASKLLLHEEVTRSQIGTVTAAVAGIALIAIG